MEQETIGWRALLLGRRDQIGGREQILRQQITLSPVIRTACKSNASALGRLS